MGYLTVLFKALPLNGSVVVLYTIACRSQFDIVNSVGPLYEFQEEEKKHILFEFLTHPLVQENRWSKVPHLASPP